MSQKNNPQKEKPMKQLEVIEVACDADGVSCDGGIGPLGHPKVWYTFDATGVVSCHYCGRKFVKRHAE